MSRLFRSALSMESHIDTAIAIDPLKAELALESAAIEVSEAVFEVQMAELQQEELEHAHASLESMALSLEALIKDDPRGLDRVSAQGYQHAMTAILGDSLPSPVASLEAFGGESECAEATKLSLEGMKDTMKKIWDGIKRSIENAIRAIADFFAKLFNGVKKLQDRIKSMQTDVAAKKKAGDKATGKFKVPGVDAVQLGGKVDQRALESGAKMVMDQVAGTADALQEAAEDYYKGLQAFYLKPGDDTSAVEGAHKKAKDKIESLKLETGELPGGKTFEYEVTKADLEFVSPPKLVDFSGKQKAPAGTVEIDVLDLNTIDKFLGEAAKFADEMAKKGDRRAKLKSARQSVVAEADKFVETGEKKLSDKWTQAKLNYALRSANADFTATIARVDGYVFKYVRALLAVLSAALGEYGNKTEVKTEEMDQDADDLNKDGSESDDGAETSGDEESTEGKK
jgi:hypothetical protein